MEDQVTTAVIIVVCTVLAYVCWQNIRYRLEHKIPYKGIPVLPNSHWLFGHLLNFGGDFQVTLKHVAFDHANEYGETSYYVLGMPVLCVSRWNDARAVLQSSVDRKVVPVITRHIHLFLGKKTVGLLTGREWKLHRNAILRAYNPKILVQSRKAMIRVSSTLIESLKERMDLNSSSNNTEQQYQRVEMDVEALMKMITIDIFGRTALSHDLGCCSTLRPSPIAKAFDFLNLELTRRMRRVYDPFAQLYSIPTHANRRHKRETRLLRSFVAELIKERFGDGNNQSLSSESEKTKDLLTLIIQAHEDLKEHSGGEDVSDAVLTDVLVSLLFAGYDTTSITLSYALYCISTNPDVEQRCIDEITRVWKKSNNADGETEVNPDDLVYCRGALLETLRLYPPATQTSRTLTKPLQLSSGFVAPEGAYIFIPIWIIQRDPNNFPRPTEFIPERWVRKSNKTGEEHVWKERVENDDKEEGSSGVPAAKRNAFLAFSAGARSCAGYKFAMQEAILVLSTLLRNLQFKVKPGYVLEPTRQGIVQHPKNGLPMIICPREGNV